MQYRPLFRSESAVEYGTVVRVPIYVAAKNTKATSYNCNKICSRSTQSTRYSPVVHPDEIVVHCFPEPVQEVGIVNGMILKKSAEVRHRHEPDGEDDLIIGCY